MYQFCLQCIKFHNFIFLYNFINDVDDEDTLKKLLDFVDENDVDDEYILKQIEILLDEYLRIIVENDLDINYDKHINQTYNYEGQTETDVDINGIEDEIRDNLDSFLVGFNENVLEKISFSTSKIVSDIDVDSKVTRYLENYEPDYDGHSHGGSYYGSTGEDDIDAIFERS